MNGLRHEACLYNGQDEFVKLMMPWVRDGIANGDPIIAVSHSANLDALRDALGADARQVEMRTSDSWYLSPAKSFRGFINFASAHPNASCVRMIGEPIWPLGWAAAVREYAHYEAVFNVIAGDSPIWARCPYATSELPDAVLEHALSTHPHVNTAETSSASGRFVEPEDYCARLAAAMSEPAEPTEPIPVTADLQSLCQAVAAEAAAAGVLPARLRSLQLAVHELAANALGHGDGSATLRTWTSADSFVCEVSSSGRELSETTAGYVPINPAIGGGRGLWLVRQLCDLVEVRSRNGRNAIRVHMRRTA